MSAATFEIERHRLAADSRQFGLWCFRVRADGRRTVIGHAVPVSYKSPRRWHVYLAREEVGSALTRKEAVAMLQVLGERAVNLLETLAEGGRK